MLSRSDFSFTKIKEDFLNMALVQSFDVLFYDAFGYHAQSEMWQEKPFKSVMTYSIQAGFG